jgi:hypothetical protein
VKHGRLGILNREDALNWSGWRGDLWLGSHMVIEVIVESTNSDALYCPRAYKHIHLKLGLIVPRL